MALDSFDKPTFCGSLNVKSPSLTRQSSAINEVLYNLKLKFYGHRMFLKQYDVCHFGADSSERHVIVLRTKCSEYYSVQYFKFISKIGLPLTTIMLNKK